jgi:glycosyltransferase involved in cell wall biosynthesis
MTPALRTHGGISRFARELARALVRACSPDEEITLFFNGSRRRSLSQRLNAAPCKVIALSKKLFRLGIMLAHLFRISQDRLIGRPDIFIASDHVLPYLLHSGSVFVVHDLTFRRSSAFHTPLNRWFLRLMMPRFLRRADAVIAVSESTRQDLLAYYSFAHDKIHVIREGVSRFFRPVSDPKVLTSVRRRYALPDRFLLCLGIVEPRKNILTVLQALPEVRAHISDIRLVIAGPKGWRIGALLKEIRSREMENALLYIGEVEEEDLPAVYTLASLFLFPSQYEGFGLPVIEAMACGVPVICSNTSSMPEIAGDAALFAPPNNASEWARLIGYMLESPKVRDGQRRKGLDRASRFTWDETAQGFLDVSRALAKSRGNHR